ncbi:MAG: hypothetical protein MUC51_20195 [Anaerolineae bacterium]|jgi:hypothetical protein|nr:hypothetical protein [Anaerolineae bacterium]
MKCNLSLVIVALAVLAVGLLTDAASAHLAAPGSPPPAPTNIRASDGTYSYMVKTTWNTSAGATSYRIFRADSANGNRTSLAHVTTNYYDDYSAWGGLKIHYYWVTACVVDHDCSQLDDSTPDSGFRGLETPDVSASDGTYTGWVRVNWSSVQSAESYTLYRGTSDAGYTTSISGLTTTSYNDTNALRGISYYYWVKAVAAIDESSIGGPDTGYRNYEAPEGVQATDGVYLDRVRVTWLGSPNAARYQVWRAPTAGGAVIKLGASASPPYDDTTAASGVSYDYSVSACNTDETICSQRSSPDAGYRGQLAATATATSTRTPTPTATATVTRTPSPTVTSTPTSPRPTASPTPGGPRPIYLPLLLR